MPLNRSDLVSAIAAKADLSKADADKALAALQDVLVDSLVEVMYYMSASAIVPCERPAVRS